MVAAYYYETSKWKPILDELRQRAEQRPVFHEKNYVYFIRAGKSGPVKIGVSKNPGSRLKMLRNSGASSYPMEVVAVVYGSPKVEKAFHSRLRNYRLAGEWFHPSLAVMELVYCVAKTMTEDEIKKTGWDAETEEWHRDFIAGRGFLDYDERTEKKVSGISIEDRYMWSILPSKRALGALHNIANCGAYYSVEYKEVAAYVVALHALTALGNQKSALTVLEQLHVKLKNSPCKGDEYDAPLLDEADAEVYSATDHTPEVIKGHDY